MRSQPLLNFGIRAGTVLQDFSDISNFTVTNGTITKESYNNGVFDYKLKVTGVPAAQCLIKWPLANPIPLHSIERVGIPMNVIDGTYTPNFWIELSSDNFAAKEAFKSFPNSAYVGNSELDGNNGDNFLPIEERDWTFAGGMTMNDIVTHARIRVGSGTGLVSICHLGELIINYYAQPVIIFIWDDENDTQLSQSYPIMESYGYKATIGFTRAFESTSAHLSTAQCLDLQDNKGWDMCNHSFDHVNFGNLTLTEQEYQISENRKYMVANGLTSAVDFMILPQGGHDENTPTALYKQGIIACRDGRVGVQSTIKGIDQKYLLKQVELNSTATAATIIPSIKDAVRYGGTLLVTGHRLVTTPGQSIDFSIAEFRIIMDFIAGLGTAVKVMKLKDWWNQLEQPRPLVTRTAVTRSMVNRNQV